MNRFIKVVLRRLLGARFYETALGAWHLGYFPHIKEPRSFNEKILNRKVYRWGRIPHELADKYSVRAFVQNTIGSQYLNDLYGVYDNADDIDFAELPESFVIKGTHGSQMNVIVHDRTAFDESAVREQCRSFLGQTYGVEYDEVWYARCAPRLLVERMMHDAIYGVPIDFKFFVFHGRVEIVQVDFDRFIQHSRSIFDRKWKRQAYGLKYPLGPDIAQPALLDEMIACAERLGGGFDFVRVDLYSPNDQEIVFGEMTFAPESGWGRFLPDKSPDFALGRCWHLS